MARSRLLWAATVLTVALVCLARTLGSRRGRTRRARLSRKHGLKIAGTLAVVDEEAQIKTNLAEARRLSKQLSYSLMQQKGTLSPGEMQQTVKNVNNEINQLRSQMNAASQQMNAVPKLRGRFVSNDAAMLYAQLNAYRNQLQMEINQDSLFPQPAQEPAGRPEGKGQDRLRGPGSARRLSSGPHRSSQARRLGHREIRRARQERRGQESADGPRQRAER